jgi:hypothetical protein
MTTLMEEAVVHMQGLEPSAQDQLACLILIGLLAARSETERRDIRSALAQSAPTGWGSTNGEVAIRW